MRISRFLPVLLLFAALPSATVPTAAANPPLAQTLTRILQIYVKERGQVEHIDAASASISTAPGDAPVLAAVGASPSSIFQIGSNTKSFTAVLALQLEAEGKLNLDAPIGQWLPQYPAWKNVTIRRLLNMTTGIPTYDDDPAFQRQFAANPYRNFSPSDLVGAVYPAHGHATFKSGWYYSNTGYILTQMILERATGNSYGDLLRKRIFTPFHLTNAYYASNVLPPAVQGRVVAGYFFSNDPENAGLKLIYNKNVRNFTLSWTQAAGGIVGTPAAVDRWVRVLYGMAILPAKQRVELRSLVSTKTGKPVAAVTQGEPRGFGLGIAQMYQPALGRCWFYEGATLGYRVAYVYSPQRNLVLVVALNSQPNAKEDHIGVLIDRIVAALPQR